jgi:thiamine biosynthesis lipoprotein
MESTTLFRFQFHAMAAEHELQLFASSAQLAERAAEAAISDVARIEAKYSRYRDDSVTTRINRAAGRERVAIDAETAALLRYADQCFQLSGGRFDITSGVLRRVWDFRAKPARIPSADALAAAQTLIGWAGVEWDDRGILLPREQMELDFGGIGKEYAADRAATICLGHGIAHALVNLGGDVRAIGGQPDGSPWRIGIRDPRAPDRAVALIEVDDGAVATSGDYERYFELDGRRYCHILDPRSGMPVTHWQSVSVVAPLCIVAGTCATIAMLLAERAPTFLASQQFDYLAIDAAGKLHRPAPISQSRGIRAKITAAPI